MKKIIITGSRRGLGKLLLQHAILKDYFVYGTTSLKNSSERSNKFEILHLDLCDEGSIDEFSDYLLKKNQDIYAIIHNSGVAYLDPAETLTIDEQQHIFAVNFFGPISLTKKLLPLMKKGQGGRIVFISSIVSLDPWPHLGVYAASKSAIEKVAFEWAVLLNKWKIFVSIVQPNPLKSDMSILRSTNANSSQYPELTERNLEWENTKDFCDVVNHILSNSSPKFLHQTGSFSKKLVNKLIDIDAFEERLLKYQQDYRF